MIRIPLTNDSRQEFQLSLEGQSVSVSITLNTLDNQWYLSLLDQSQNELALLRRMVDRELILGYRKPGFNGDFILISNLPNIKNKQLDLTTSKLLYLNEKEIEEYYF